MTETVLRLLNYAFLLIFSYSFAMKAFASIFPKVDKHSLNQMRKLSWKDILKIFVSLVILFCIYFFSYLTKV